MNTRITLFIYFHCVIFGISTSKVDISINPMLRLHGRRILSAFGLRCLQIHFRIRSDEWLKIEMDGADYSIPCVPDGTGSEEIMVSYQTDMARRCDWVHFDVFPAWLARHCFVCGLWA